MGSPRGKNVVSELFSALGALHMPPDRLVDESIDEDFIDETFKFAKHAREHIQSALAVYQEEQTCNPYRFKIRPVIEELEMLFRNLTEDGKDLLEKILDRERD